MSRSEVPPRSFLRAGLGIVLTATALLVFCTALAAQSPGPEITPETESSVLPGWAASEFLGLRLWQYLVAFVLVLVGLVLKKLNDYVIGDKLLTRFKQTRFQFDNLLTEALYKPLGYLFLLAGVAAACLLLTLGGTETAATIRHVSLAVLKVFLALDLVWFLFRLVDVMVHYLAGLASRTESTLDDQLVPLVRKALKITIVLIGALWAMQLLGFNVTSLLAGLGIGGLAVALALQDTLANFFGSVFIFLDKPFRIGDWVKIGDVEGVVEEIGFRSTRIRSFPKTLVSMPNKTVAAATIDNCSMMPKRRVMQTVGVTYETRAHQMEQAVASIQRVLENDPGVDKEFIVVRFTEFGASSLDILLCYFTIAVPFAEHAQTRERINLAVMRELENLGLSIAFPTRTLYLEGDVARRLVGAQLPAKGAAPPVEESGT